MMYLPFHRIFILKFKMEFKKQHLKKIYAVVSISQKNSVKWKLQHRVLKTVIFSKIAGVTKNA